MKYRKLRITWSVVWGALAALLCVLWVRSHRVADIISLRLYSSTVLGITLDKGGVLALFYSPPTTPTQQVPFHMRYPPGPRIPNFKPWTYGNVSTGRYVQAPLSLSVVGALLLAAAPWSRYQRFSLRTLLIATTLVAVVLGLIVWAARG